MELPSHPVLEDMFETELGDAQPWSASALFDQYDEAPVPANDDCYENLYPNIA